MKGSNSIRGNRGVTLIEIMIVVAVMSVLFIGLYTLINKTGTNLLHIGSSLSLAGQASEAMYWIGNDFRNAKASSMGNLGPNPGFEEPGSFPHSSPEGWEVLNTDILRSSARDDVKNGFSSIVLAKSPTDYDSNIFSIPDTKPYILSGWANGTRTGRMRLVRTDNSELLGKNKVNAYWEHLTTSTVISAGEIVKLKLSNLTSTWNYLWPIWPQSYAACVYQDRLFFGNANNIIHVYDNSNWSQQTISTPLFPIWDTLSMCVYNNRLYAAGGDLNNNVGSWSYFYDGSNWTRVNPQFPAMVSSICVYNGSLYAGTFYNGAINNGRVYVNNGANWSLAWTVPVGAKHVNSLCVYNNKLYIGIGGSPRFSGGGWVNSGQVYEYDGVSWTETLPINIGGYTNGSIYCMCVYNGKLYAGGISYWPGPPFSFTSQVVFCYDGISWDILNFGFGGIITNLYLYENKLV